MSLAFVQIFSSLTTCEPSCTSQVQLTTVYYWTFLLHLTKLFCSLSTYESLCISQVQLSTIYYQTCLLHLSKPCPHANHHAHLGLNPQPLIIGLVSSSSFDCAQIIVHISGSTLNHLLLDSSLAFVLLSFSFNHATIFLLSDLVFTEPHCKRSQHAWCCDNTNYYWQQQDHSVSHHR